jgi:hypothetical protein
MFGRSIYTWWPVSQRPWMVGGGYNPSWAQSYRYHPPTRMKPWYILKPNGKGLSNWSFKTYAPVTFQETFGTLHAFSWLLYFAVTFQCPGGKQKQWSCPKSTRTINCLLVQNGQAVREDYFKNSPKVHWSKKLAGCKPVWFLCILQHDC